MEHIIKLIWVQIQQLRHLYFGCRREKHIDIRIALHKSAIQLAHASRLTADSQSIFQLKLFMTKDCIENARRLLVHVKTVMSCVHIKKNTCATCDVINKRHIESHQDRKPSLIVRLNTTLRDKAKYTYLRAKVCTSQSCNLVPPSGLTTMQ